MGRRIILILLLILSHKLYSQILPIRTYFTDNGLASSQVWSIIEDKKGYIWFGCSSGISRFNGFRFKNFRLKEGLPSESITKLAASNSGITIAQTVKGIAYLEPECKKFKPVPEIGEISDIAVADLVYDYRSRKKYPVIFAVIKNKGIAKFDIAKGKWDTCKFAPLKPTSILFLDGKIIFSTFNGTIYQTNPLLTKAEKIGKTNSPATKIKTSEGKLILISEHSVNLLENQKTTQIFATPNNEEIVFDATFDKSRNLWIATNLGLRKKTGKNTYLYTSKNGLPGIRVLSTFQSSEGILWFGTNHGVCKLVSEDMLVYRDAKYRRASSYICFYYDKEKETMMIGNTSGVMLIEKNEIHCIDSPYLKKFPVWDIEKDKNGNFYFATEGGGLVKITPKGKETHLRYENNCLPGNNITDILIKNDNVYVACKEGFAIIRKNKYEKYSISSGLPVSYVRCLEDAGDSVILGTLGAGILVCKNGKISPFLPQTPKELKSIYDIYLDKKTKTMWVATNYGLAKIKDKKIKFYDTENGFLPFGLSAVYPVKNFLWIGSDGGAQLFDPEKEKVIKILTKDDGLPGNEFTTHNAIMKDPHNNIWFGFFGGAAKIENLGLNLNSNKDFNPRIFPVSVKYYYKDKSVFKHTFPMKKIVIPYGAKEIFITFDAIWFKNEYTLNLEYKLEGINAVWNKINNFKNMKVYYTNLKPGVYPLFIKASSISTNKTIAQKVLEIKTPTPWWQNTKIRIALVSAALLLIYLTILGFTEYKTKKLKKEKEKLDKLVRKKTEQLDILNKELQKKNAILKDLSEHDPLTGLYNRRYLSQMLEVYQKSVFRDKKTGACLLLFDIDFFKKINDTYGHDAGDIVLQTVAKTMLETIRESDVAIRFGGEEFLIILTKLEKENPIQDAYVVAEKIRKKIQSLSINYLGKEIKITVSGGISCFDFKNFSKKRLYEKLKEVDEKLYKAKNSGRNIIVM